MAFIARIRTALATACVCLAASGAIALTLPAGASATTSPPCGPTTYYKSNGAPWVCSFDDEFNGTSLDTTKWTAFASEPGGFRGGDECYSPRHVTVGSGVAKLNVTRASGTFDCAGVPAHYYSGMILSRGKFSQTYGRIQMRAKIPNQVGLQGAFWMLPENPYHADGYDYGEIDVMENFGSYPNHAAAHLHNVYTPGTPMLGKFCDVPNMATEYHTYTLTWTSTSMTFSYDGTTCWKTTWTTIPGYQPVGATAPNPFNQPFYIIINMAVGTPAITPDNVPNSSTTLPAAMQISYLRVWK